MSEVAAVARWIAQVHGERLRAVAAFVAATASEPMSQGQVRNLVLQDRDIAPVPAEADPDLKADLYVKQGVQVRYDPFERVITPPADSCAKARVGEGTDTFSDSVRTSGDDGHTTTPEIADELGKGARGAV